MKDRPTRSSCCRAGLPAGVLASALWLALLSAITPVVAQAQALAALPAADLARALTLAQQAAEHVAPAGAVVTARLGVLDARLNPAACAQAEAFLPRGVPVWGRTRVGLRCTRGAVPWTLYLPVQVQVQASAVVLRKPLPAGSVLSEGDLALALADWSAKVQVPLSDLGLAAGRTLARAGSPGEPLREADLQPRRWFAAGDRVTVVSGGKGFAIAAEGQALSEGRDGQRVRVQMLPRVQDGSSSPGPVVQGQAVGERRVELFQ